MANRKISPDICAYFDEDDDALKIEVELPGVKKKDITFRLREDSFYIRAPKDDYEYIGSYAVCCLVHHPILTLIYGHNRRRRR